MTLPTDLLSVRRVVALVLCLLLAACGGSSGDDTTTTTEVSAETIDPAGDEAAESEDDDDDEVAVGGASQDSGAGTADPDEGDAEGSADDEATTDDPTDDDTEDGFAGPAECVVGEWLSDNSLFLAALQEFGSGVQSVTGEVTVTFGDDGRMTTVYDGWEITAEVEGATVVVNRSGVDRGDYSVSEQGISITETEMTSVLSMNAAGTVMEVASDPQVLVDAPFTCDETELWITAYGEDHRMARR